MSVKHDFDLSISAVEKSALLLIPYLIDNQTVLIQVIVKSRLMGAGGSNNEAGELRWSSMLADYKFSKRNDVYAGLAYADCRGAKFTNAGQPNTNITFMVIGIRHKF